FPSASKYVISSTEEVFRIRTGNEQSPVLVKANVSSNELWVGAVADAATGEMVKETRAIVSPNRKVRTFIVPPHVASTAQPRALSGRWSRPSTEDVRAQVSSGNDPVTTSPAGW